MIFFCKCGIRRQFTITDLEQSEQGCIEERFAGEALADFVHLCRCWARQARSIGLTIYFRHKIKVNGEWVTTILQSLLQSEKVIAIFLVNPSIILALVLKMGDLSNFKLRSFVDLPKNNQAFLRYF